MAHLAGADERVLSTGELAGSTRATQTLENSDTRLTFSTDIDLRLLSVENINSGTVFNFKDKEPWRILLRETTTGSWLTVHPDTHSNSFNYTFTNHGAYKEIVATWENMVIDGLWLNRNRRN